MPPLLLLFPLRTRLTYFNHYLNDRVTNEANYNLILAAQLQSGRVVSYGSWGRSCGMSKFSDSIVEDVMHLGQEPYGSWFGFNVIVWHLLSWLCDLFKLICSSDTDSRTEGDTRGGGGVTQYRNTGRKTGKYQNAVSKLDEITEFYDWSRFT